MQTKEWRFVDKSKWGDGLWNEEPDKIQWLDEATGLSCMIRRNQNMGFLCGYVGVPSSHPMHGVDYNNCNTSVHGGLTYSDKCNDDGEHPICHEVEPGEDDNIWWLGFDCGHAGDRCPGEAALRLTFPIEGQYRDLAYVKEECVSLAKQLSEMVP